MTFNSIYIIGATASGKSELAIKLSEKLNGVIINADSMQVYSGANVITACPSDDELNQAPHKLYNVIDPSNDFNVVDWVNMATTEAENCFNNNTTPILCGGTGFYVSNFVDGISPIPDVDKNIRNEVRKLSAAQLYESLKAEDEIMATRLKDADSQRMARALEIVRSTGKSLSHFQNMPKQKLQTSVKPLIVGLLPDREIVYNKINARFETMFDDGVDEVQKLLDSNLNEDSQLMRAIGIPELIKYIRGQWDKDTAIEKAQTASRQYAKRQMTFIRTQLNTDIQIESVDEIEKVVEAFKKQ
ncbi:MAG: tRNA (adenosine(37)-N6)-dimethylallyltransferase MiaA [Alphaproteobacteria bacterium]